MNRNQLVEHIQTKGSYLCVGLDTDPTLLPKHLAQKPNAVFSFNKAIIDATKEYCVSYKLNTAFYEAQGIAGWEALQQTINYIPATHFTIADAKRGDIGNTSHQYAKTFFEVYNFDAVTVAPYMGEDSIRPFLEYENKWTIVLGLTSNKGSNDFQQLTVTGNDTPGTLLFEKVLTKVCTWASEDNLMFVVGATHATALTHIRSLVPNHFLLVPGVGSQGGSLQQVSQYGLNRQAGLLVNASRAIIYAGNGEDFAEKAGEVAAGYANEMQQYLPPN